MGWCVISSALDSASQSPEDNGLIARIAEASSRWRYAAMMSDWLLSSANSSFNAVEVVPDVARHASAILARFSAETMFVLARKKRTIPQPWATAIPPTTINAIVVSKRIVARIITARNFPQGLFL